MRCPGCGKELEDGALYCMECGEEITIVPVYEPDIELTIDEALGTISTDVQKQAEVEIYISLEENRRNRYNIVLTTVLTIVGVLLICLGVGIFCVTRYSSDYLWNHGHRLQTMAKYDKAIECYEKYYKLQNIDLEVFFSIAECYDALGALEETINTLIFIYENGNEGQVMRAFELLLPILEEKGDYQRIHQLIDGSKYESMKNIYVDYLSQPPKFSFEEGFYIEIIPLKLYSGSEGIIYYTLDGSTPTLESEIYKNTIFLDEGEHIVSAMFVNQYGLCSQVITKTYNIYFEDDENSN